MRAVERVGFEENGGVAMGIFSWLVLGLVAGAIARLIMPTKGPQGVLLTAVIGVAGAFIGGFIGAGLGLGSVRGFDLTSLFLATVGAAVLLLIYHGLRGRDSD